MPLIDSANARQMAAKSHESRRLRKLAAQIKPAIPQLETLEAGDSYVRRRLLRVRGQLERLGDMLDDEEDPGRIDKLCSAIARLSEQEQRLADRPLPGSRRPPKEINRRSHGAYGSPAEPKLDLLQESMVVPSFQVPPPEPELDPEYKPPTPAQPEPATIAPTTASPRVSVSVGIASKAPIPTKVQPVKPKKLVLGPRGVPEYR